MPPINDSNTPSALTSSKMDNITDASARKAKSLGAVAGRSPEEKALFNSLKPTQREQVVSTVTIENERRFRAAALEEGARSRADEINPLAASFATGVAGLSEQVGSIYGGVTGNMDNPLREISKSARGYWQDRKPWSLKNKEQERSERIAAADGTWDKFTTAIGETVTDPALITSLLAEQVPNIAGAGLVGKAVGAGLTAATGLKGAAKLTALATGNPAAISKKAIGAISGGAALAAGSTLQGAEVGGSTYDELMARPESEWNDHPRFAIMADELGDDQLAKEAISLQEARLAFAESAVVSLVSQRLPGSGALEKAIARSASKIKSGPVSRVGSIAKSTIGETAQEIIEEGSGQIISNARVKTVDTERDIMEGVGEAAGLGAVGGGVMGAIGGAVKPSEAAVRKLKQQRNLKGQESLAEKAVETGEVSELLAEGTPTYNPAKAASALAKRSVNKDLTTEERTASQEKLDKISNRLVNRQAVNAAVIADASKEGKAKLETQVTEYTKQVEEATDPARKADLGEVLSLAEDRLTKANEITPVDLKTLESEYAADTKTLERVKDAEQSALAETQLDTKEDTDAAVATMSDEKAEAPAKSEAAKTVLRLAMRDSESPSLTTEVLESLVTNSTGFTTDEQAYVRALSEQRVKQNMFKDDRTVSKEITDGGEGFMGLSDYSRDMGSAIRGKNKKQAKDLIMGINRFATSHTAKATKAKEAVELAKSSNQKMYVVRGRNGPQDWKVTEQLPDKWATGANSEARALNGGLVIYPGGGSDNLVNGISEEAELITATANQMKASAKLAFTPQDAAPAPQASDDEYADVLGKAEAEADPTDYVQTPVEAPAQQGAQAEESVPVDPSLTLEGNPKGESPLGIDPDFDALLAGLETREEREVRQANEEAAKKAAPVDTYETVKGVDPDFDALLDGLETADEREARQVAEKIAESPGAIDILRDGAEEVNGLMTNADFRTKNLVSAYFRQKLDGNRPLVMVKSLLTAWKGNRDVMAPFYSKLPDKELGASQSQYLKLFMDTASTWAKRIDRNIQTSKVGEGYSYNDLVQYFKELGEENITAAVAFGAFTWAIDSARDGGFNDTTAINSLLNRVNDHPISEIETTELSLIGGRDKVVIQRIGKLIVESLGLQAHPGASAEMQARLEASFGAQGLAVLVQEGWVERHQVKSGLLDKITVNMKVNGKMTEVNYGHPFVRVVRDFGANGVPLTNDKMIDAVEKAKLAGTVLEKLFGVDARRVDPVTEKPKFTDKRPKRSRKGIPEVLSKILNKVGGESWVMQPMMTKAREAFSRDNMLTMAEYRDTEGEFIQATRRISVDAKNQSIARDYDNLEIYAKGLNGIKKFYFEGSVWIQQRVGIKSNTVDPQGSTLQRHSMSKSAWEAEVDTNEPNSDDMLRFRLVVAQALGVDTDKQMDEISLIELDAMLDKPIFKMAISTLVDMNNLIAGNELTPDEQELIMQAVKVAGKGFHSLDGLMAMAAYEVANDPRTPETTFKTSIMHEVDGVSNGPGLTQILMGTMTTKLAEKFGMYGKDSEHTHYTSWRSKGGQDFYETFAGDLVKFLHNVVLKGNPDKKDVPGQVRRLTARVNAIEVFTKPLLEDGKATKSARGLVKKAITAVIFGSVSKNAVKGMSQEFLDSVYLKLEDAANNPEKLPAVVQALNDILRGMALPAVTINTSEQAANLVMSKEQEARIKSAFSSTIGKSMEAALDDNLGGFIQKRELITDASALAFRLYDGAYQLLREQLMGKQVEAGLAPLTSNGLPLQDLTTEQDAEIRAQLKDMEPVVHTAMSKLSGDINSGLMLSKVVIASASDENPAYVGLSKFTDGVAATNQKDSKALKTLATKRTETDPGVGVTVLLTHALDSAIAALSYGKVVALNIHDALGLGLRDVIKGAIELNKNTFQVLAGYSMPMEVSATLERTAAGFTELVKTNPELGDVFLKIANSLQDAKDPFTTIEQATKWLQETTDLTAKGAFNIEEQKLEFLSTLGHIDQYALEGGSYLITEADLTKVADSITAIQNERAARNFPVRKKPKPVVVESSSPMDTTWGPVGAPKMAGDSMLEKDLIKYADSNGQMPVKKMAAVIRARMSKGEFGVKAKKQYTALLTQVEKLATVGTVVQLVDKNTAGKPGVENIKDARAMYEYDGSQDTIYVKTSDFVHGVITVETLLHELTHAAVAKTIADPNASPEVKAAIAALKEVLAVTRTHLKDNNNTDYDQAVANVDELVSWGMTNGPFMRVLAGIQMQAEPEIGGLSSAMKRFVTGLKKVLFAGTTKSQEQVDTTGLSTLIAHTATLMQAAGKANDVGKLQFVQRDDHPRNFTTEQVFDGLAGIGNSMVTDPQRKAHLKGLLSDLVSTIYGPYGVFKRDAEQSAPVNPQDTFLEALHNKTAPFASTLIGVLPMSYQEAFVAESVEATLRESMNVSRVARTEMARIFRQAKASISAEDFLDDGNVWATATNRAKEIAEKRYNLLFVPTSQENNTSDFLSKFAAAALVYAPLSEKLAQLQLPLLGSEQPTTLWEAIKFWFSAAMTQLRYAMTGIRNGQDSNARLMTLTKTLVRLEAGRKSALEKEQGTVSKFIEGNSDKLSEVMRAKVEKLGKSDFFQNSKINVVKASGSVLSAVAGERANLLLSGIVKMRDKVFQERQGLTASVIGEMRGAEWLMQLLLMGANNHERARKQAKDETAANIRASFGDTTGKKKPRKLTRDELKAATQILRADLSSLSGKEYALEDIERVLSDESAMEQSIEIEIAKLSGPYVGYMQRAAHTLGYQMMSQEVKSVNQMFNAHSIATLSNTRGAVDAAHQSKVAELTPIIDRLATLYAIKHMDTAKRSTLVQLMRSEAQRKDGGNGVDFLMRSHTLMKSESLVELFQSDPIQMMKGYTKETFNHHIDMQVAGELRGAELVAAGYRKGDPVPKDVHDPSQEQLHIYHVHGFGLPSLVSGAISFTGQNSRGKSMHGGINKAGMTGVFTGNLAKSTLVTSQRAAAIDKLLNEPLVVSQRFNPAAEKRTYMAPVLDLNGNAANYRYMMNDRNKDDVMQRENRIDQVMGTMAASLLDKAKSPEMNEKAVDALRQQYKEDYATNPEAYIMVSANSSDPAIRDAYNMLPRATQQYIVDTWGRPAMQVRNDQYDLIFGYRKVSIAGLFDMSPDDLNILQKMLVKTTTAMVGPKAALYLRRGESGWQEIVSEIKDILVIKNLFTLLGNISSNTIELMRSGVSMVDIAKSHGEGLAAVIELTRDRKELNKLEAMLEKDYMITDRAESESRVVELKDAIARNPVSGLVDLGMFSTIVEDLDNQDDNYSYASKLSSLVEDHTAWVPDSVKTVAKNIYMAHGTPIYDVLSKTTHLSDFLARYTLHKHVTTRPDKRLSDQESYELAMDTFVHYDIPTHRNLQYLNDHGILWFTKYYLRIQRVIFRMMRDQPARTMALVAAENYFTGLQTMLDSSMVTRMGNNPMGTGAFGFFHTLDELITVQAGAALIK